MSMFDNVGLSTVQKYCSLLCVVGASILRFTVVQAVSCGNAFPDGLFPSNVTQLSISPSLSAFPLPSIPKSSISCWVTV